MYCHPIKIKSKNNRNIFTDEEEKRISKKIHMDKRYKVKQNTINNRKFYKKLHFYEVNI